MKLTKTLIVFAALASSAFGATVSLGILTDTGVVNASNVALDSSYTVYLGTYTGGALTSTSTFADINGSFTSVTSATFGTGDAAGYNGYAAIGSTFYDAPDASGIGGDQIFAFITDGANQNALLSGFGVFPLNTDVPNFLDLTIEAANVGTYTFLLGSYDSEGSNQLGSGGNVVLNNAAIPEPSAALLGAVGAIGLLRRRRN